MASNLVVENRLTEVASKLAVNTSHQVAKRILKNMNTMTMNTKIMEVELKERSRLERAEAHLTKTCGRTLIRNGMKDRSIKQSKTGRTPVKNRADTGKVRTVK